MILRSFTKKQREVIKEALKQYIDNRSRKYIDIDDDERTAREIIQRIMEIDYGTITK